MLTTTVCAALSAAGLAVAFLTAYRRRFVAALKIAAAALLPVGLAMAGLVELGGKVVAAVGGWAADLVLRPTVWAGFGVLAVAALLYLVARFADRRAGGRATPGGGRPVLDGGARRGGRGGGALTSSTGAGARRDADDDDFSEIEEILRRHGI